MRQSLDWTQTPESSSIAAFAYTAEDMMLFVRFKTGRTYRYLGVPAGVYGAFAWADSKGIFFNSQIQGRYAFNQI
jgi:hypothetical protein